MSISSAFHSIYDSPLSFPLTFLTRRTLSVYVGEMEPYSFVEHIFLGLFSSFTLFLEGECVGQPKVGVDLVAFSTCALWAGMKWERNLDASQMILKTVTTLSLEVWVAAICMVVKLVLATAAHYSRGHLSIARKKVTALIGYARRTYQYYTFTTFRRREDFRKLSSAEVDAARVHFVTYSNVWNGFSLAMQVAFNQRLKQEGKKEILFTAALDDRDQLSRDELIYYAESCYRASNLNAERAQFLFDRNIPSPDYALRDNQCPQIDLETVDVASLSDARVHWLQKVLMVAKEDTLSDAKCRDLGRRFFVLNLLPPNRRLVFHFDLSRTDLEQFSIQQAIHCYYDYYLDDHYRELSFEHQVRLHKLMQPFEIDTPLPPLELENISTSPDFVLRVYRDQYHRHPALWYQCSDGVKRRLNEALGRDRVQIDTGTWWGDWIFSSLNRVSPRLLMRMEYAPTHDEELATLEKERINFIHPSMVAHLPDEKVRHIRRPDLIQAIPDDKLYLIHPSVWPLLTSDQRKAICETVHPSIPLLPEEKICYLQDPWLIQALPDNKLAFLDYKTNLFYQLKHSPFERALRLVFSCPKELWNELKLMRNVFNALSVWETKRLPEISNLRSDLSRWLAEVSEAFGIPFDRDSWKEVERVLIEGGAKTAFFSSDTREGQEEREKMRYDFKHFLHALTLLQGKSLDQQTRDTVVGLLTELQSVTGLCKNSWVAGVNNFQGLRHEHCNCQECSEKRECASQPQLKAVLDAKLALFKRECFMEVLAQAYPNDSQSTHTIEWYAQNLPHLNLHSGYLDAYQDISRRWVSPQAIEARLLDRFLRRVKPQLKKLIGYGPGSDPNLRDVVLSYMKGILDREARMQNITLSGADLSDLAGSFIFDEHNGYAVKESFIDLILYVFDYFSFDIENPVLHQVQSNNEPFSVNLDYIRTKMAHLRET